MKNSMVKQDINLLEYPLWFQDECEAKKTQTGFVWKLSREEGTGKEFVLRTSFKPPVKTDLIFLLFFLMESQKRAWKDEIKISRYQVLKNCGLGTGAPWYERLKESLDRWEEVHLEFNDVFYNGYKYKTLHCGVIDSWGIDDETKLLRVRFSPEYLSMVKETAYYRYLNFDQVKKLRSPLATRLYQLLIKTFQNRDIWEIDSVLLAEKIPMKQRFPAQIALKVKPAVRRIYKHTDLKVTLEERKKERGKIVFVFHKEPEVGKAKIKTKEEKPFVMPETDEFKKLVALLPEERQRQKSLLELVSKALNKKGFDYVEWNIRYANTNSIGNYPAYFLKALQGNFGAVLKEELEVFQAHRMKIRGKHSSNAVDDAAERKAKQIAKQKEAQAQEEATAARIQNFLNTITPEARETIEREAFEKMPKFLRKTFEEMRTANHISFQSLVRMVAMEKMKAAEATQPVSSPVEMPEVME